MIYSIRWIRLAVTLCAVALAAPSFANAGEPPWIEELIQDDETVEVGLLHTYLSQGPDEFNMDEELLTLARFGPDGEVKVLFDKQIFTRDDDDVECTSDCLFPDEEACAGDPSCLDCDDDGTPECAAEAGCWIYGCKSSYVDDCAPPGEHTYVLYGSMGATDLENIDCDHPYEESIMVAEVGQGCPIQDDTFDCYEPGDDEPDDGRPAETPSCDCMVTPSRPANSLILAIIALCLTGHA